MVGFRLVDKVEPKTRPGGETGCTHDIKEWETVKNHAQRSVVDSVVWLRFSKRRFYRRFGY